jgi:hypothetical protein
VMLCKTIVMKWAPWRDADVCDSEWNDGVILRKTMKRVADFAGKLQ